MNTATHCEKCKVPLGKDRYNISPEGGGICEKRGWCPKCYEYLQSIATKNR